MNGMLLSLWGKMSDWVSTKWTQTTYIIVVCILGVCGLLLLSTYLKSNFNKGKKVKWAPPDRRSRPFSSQSSAHGY